MTYNDFHNTFALYHQKPLTVTIHFITSLLLFKYVSQLCYHESMFLLFYMMLLLIYKTNLRLILFTLSILHLNSYCMGIVNTKYAIFCILIQYMSHVISGEFTYLSTYVFYENTMYKYVEHVVLTIPAIFDSFQSDIVYRKNKICYGKVTEHGNSCNKILKWVYDRVNIKDQTRTSHWWYSDVSSDLQESFDALNMKVMHYISACHTSYNIERIDEMNEIYVSSNASNVIMNSDSVFYNKHIDGPYYIFPLCSVYRCILALNENENITTSFPTAKKSYTLSNGEFVGFDFNRDIHYISSKKLSTEYPRVTLKLHYLIYPKYLYWFAMILYKLNVQYDKHARDLFLYTLTPNTFLQKALSIFVNSTTNITYNTEEYVGIINLMLILWISIIQLC